MEKTIRLGVYRVLRKLGVTRDYIYPEATFKNDLFFDDSDWNCFLFFIEEQFKISINDEEALKMVTIDNSIQLVNKHLSVN
jgi:acyl carrier protein